MRQKVSTSSVPWTITADSNSVGQTKSVPLKECHQHTRVNVSTLYELETNWNTNTEFISAKSRLPQRRALWRTTAGRGIETNRNKCLEDKTIRNICINLSVWVHVQRIYVLMLCVYVEFSVGCHYQTVTGRPGLLSLLRRPKHNYKVIAIL